jgi:hypothetical protein
VGAGDAREKADVDAGHVVHGEDAHRHAEVLQRAVDFLGQAPSSTQRSASRP